MLRTLKTKVDVNLTQHCLYFTFRAEKKKMNEKMKEGEKQEEVDDSGFFSGKIILLSNSVAPTNFLFQPFLFHPLYRWSGTSGGCDHHYGR